MPLSRDTINRTIVDKLTPVIGRSMSEAAVEGHCSRLGIGTALSESEADRLLAEIAKGLRIFVGREKADELLEELQAAVKGAE